MDQIIFIFLKLIFFYIFYKKNIIIWRAQSAELKGLNGTKNKVKAELKSRLKIYRLVMVHQGRELDPVHHRPYKKKFREGEWAHDFEKRI